LNYDGKDLRPADVFALGASLWELASRTPLPNQGPEWRALREGVWSDLYGVSAELNHLIRRMMEPDPSRRVTMEQVLSHPLLNRHPETLRLDLHKERVKVAKLMGMFLGFCAFHLLFISLTFELFHNLIQNFCPAMGFQPTCDRPAPALLQFFFFEEARFEIGLALASPSVLLFLV
jgi:serine/threonine protein kinase